MSTRRKRASMPADNMRGILYLLDQHKDKIPTQVVESIKKLALDSISILATPDALTQRIGTIMLVIRESSTVVKRTVDGQEQEYYKVTDRVGFNWAIVAAHKLISDMGKKK